MGAVVVGGGPGGLMAAEVLSSAGVEVAVLERMAAPGRKLLLAGRGGLNLTHTERLDDLLDRYGRARPRLEAAIRAFGPDDVRAWSAGLGEETFVGTSGRVFPEGFRATPLLRAWLRRLDDLGVVVTTRYRWSGFDDAATADAGAVVLAVGGASWPRSGSDGRWVGPVRSGGVAVVPLRPSNVGFAAEWSEPFRERFAGAPLKNVALAHEGTTVRGEAVVTETGIEGGAVYALAASIRDAIERDGATVVEVDLRPDRTVDQLAERLRGGRHRDSTSTALRRAGVAAVGIGLLREATGNRPPTGADALAALVKAVPVQLFATLPIDRAISSAGGVALDEVDGAFMLRRRPGTFVVGEMLDWEAPTGGYLLQATLSTAVAAARGAVAWLAGERP